MPYAIARIAKLKGGSVEAAGRHVDRTRDTPNADPERLRDNELLIGDQRSLHEIVKEVIAAHGGKPRSDSVECVELFLGASPEHFTNSRGEVDEEKTRRFRDKALEFLREQYGTRIVKATLHRDEKTPHIQAFLVPIHAGKLNCKAIFGGREKLRQFQDAYAEKMQPLGLERGVEGSRATHEKVKHFYAAIDREINLNIRTERLPDPPRMWVKEAAKEEYKRHIAATVAEELREPLQTLRHQAMLTKEEVGKREAADKRAAQADARQNETELRLTIQQRENARLREQTTNLTAQLEAERERTATLTTQVQRLSDRVRDIPMTDVMQRLGYIGEQHEQTTIYRATNGTVAMTISERQVIHDNRLVARNAIDLTMYMHQLKDRNREMTPREAITWLAEQFGTERAVAASMTRAEQSTREQIGEHERQREAERARQQEQERERRAAEQRSRQRERDDGPSFGR